MSDRPKILILQAAANPLTGVWTVMRILINWLKTQGDINVAVGIWAKESWPQSYREDLERLEIPHFISKVPDFRFSYLLNFFSQAGNQWVQQLHDTFKPEHIVVHFHDAYMAGLYVPIRAKLDCPLSVIATFHGAWTYTKAFTRFPRGRRFLHALMARRLTTHHVTLTSVDSQGIVKAQTYYGIPQNRFHLIPNAIEDQGQHGGPRLKDSTQALTVGFVGSFIETKGWRLVGEAVERLHAAGKKIRLIFAGGGGGEYQHASDWSSTRQQFVSFKGFVQDAGVNLIPQLDVLALPSRQEGMPMVIMEAISCGVPVVGTAVDGIPDMVIDGHNGFLVERDPHHIAAALEKLSDDLELQRTMSQNARRVFLEKFEIGKVGQMYLKLYQDLPGGSGRT